MPLGVMVVKVIKVKNKSKFFRNWVCGGLFSDFYTYVSPTISSLTSAWNCNTKFHPLGLNKASLVIKVAMPFHSMSKIHLRSKIQAQGHTRGQTHTIPMEDLVLDMLSVGRDGSERGSVANSIRSDEAQLQHQISFEDLKWRSLSIPHYESYLNVALA